MTYREILTLVGKLNESDSIHEFQIDPEYGQYNISNMIQRRKRNGKSRAWSVMINIGAAQSILDQGRRLNG